jgi:glutathione synthase/RimK-type ligase-like ATP-grasp enzyme
MPSPSRRAPRVALITFSGRPALTADDGELRDALVSRGAEVEARPWDRDADWASYDSIVLRSCWNFHHRPQEFLRWLTDIGDRYPGRLRNAPEIARWSVDKRYLEDLASRGIRIVPTTWVSAHACRAAPSLAAILESHDADVGAVVKPAISATAHETWRIAPGDAAAHEERFRQLVASSPGGVMVQPFVPEILGGEWSQIFLGGEYSHAVVKRPAAGDFRVQHDFGGSIEVREPSAALVADARSALSAAAAATGARVTEILYARVDGVDRDDRLMLMELELIEPVLFFAHAPGSALRMAELILESRGPTRS